MKIKEGSYYVLIGLSLIAIVPLILKDTFWWFKLIIISIGILIIFMAINEEIKKDKQKEDLNLYKKVSLIND